VSADEAPASLNNEPVDCREAPRNGSDPSTLAAGVRGGSALFFGFGVA